MSLTQLGQICIQRIEKINIVKGNRKINTQNCKKVKLNKGCKNIQAHGRFKGKYRKELKPLGFKFVF